MKFRIIRYYERYQPQVFENNEYKNIGLPNGYATIVEARAQCASYKAYEDIRIVEEFEL